MNYCKQILKKSLRELKYEDLISFFQDEREENEVLEFKSFGRETMDSILNKHVFRTVSAFLNSSGGILILGSPVPKEIVKSKKKVKVCQGELTHTSEFIEKDTLINRISTSISYMPVGINIEVIEHKNKYLYIIEVQESNSKPHQHNGIYNIRLDGQSKPAPHYLVDAMFNQIKYPELDVMGFFAVDLLINSQYKILAYLFIANESHFLNALDYKYRIDFLSEGMSFENSSGSFHENIRFKIEAKTLAAGDNEKVEEHFYVDSSYADKDLFIRISIYGSNVPLTSTYYKINVNDDKIKQYDKPISTEIFKNIKGQENKKVIEELRVLPH